MIRFTLRLPGTLHAQLAEAAREDRRSMNGEILWLLAEALLARSKAARRRRADS